jgi:yecA family protein
LVPPDLKDIGSIAFTADDHRHLHGWLSEEGWPKDRMNIDMLEGYLVAMIVWPVELSPGAWLPAIWGIRGWKVADKISAPALYRKFSLLIVGYRQHLASIVNTKPRSYVPGFRSASDDASESDAAMHWSVGFLSALQGGAQGFNWRTAEVTAAVQVIASHTHSKSHGATALKAIAAELGAAVVAIVLDRSVGRDSSATKIRHTIPLH